MGRTARLCRGALRVADKTLNWTVLAAILAVAAIGSYALWDSEAVHAAGSVERYQEHKPAQDGSAAGFAQLQADNREVVAWLTVYGTNIDFPVTQASDNMKYVTTDATGQYSASGAVFLDAANAADFTDFNSILYGHHMEKRAMFGDLGDFADGEYFDARAAGALYVDGRWRGIEFFAFTNAEAGAPAVFTPAINGDDSRQQYLDGLLRTAVHTRQVGVTAADRLVLLSTCSTQTTNGRDILVGRITDSPAPDPFNAATAATAQPNWWSQLPIWLRITLIAAPLAGVIWFVVARARRRSAARTASVGLAVLALVGVLCGLPGQTASATEKAALATTRAGNLAAAATAVTINQEFSDLLGAAPASDFSYELAPAGLGGGPDSAAKLTGTVQGWIEATATGRAGSAFYNLRCVTPDQPGYVLDRRVYSVEVVEDSIGVAAVVVRNPEGEKTAAPTFEHYYGLDLGPWPALETESMVESRIAVKVTGEPQEDHLFAFELHSAEVQYAAATATRALAASKRLEITGQGEGLFEPWAYSAAGIYRHTISQVDLGHPAYIYDQEVYTVTDVVGRAGGSLVATRGIVDSAGRAVTELTFANHYVKSGAGTPSASPAPNPAPNPALPFTGANSMSVLGLAGLAGGAGLWLIFAARRRRREADPAS
ncbi:MAG: sortase [Bifidobacteriaceae bacterium]|jgi:sortase B|nr:sortase [Bifidobacteriaceae bacterium]